MSLTNPLGKLRNYSASSLVFLILTLSNVSALDLVLYDTTYYNGETLQAQLDTKDVSRELDARDFVLYKYEGGNLTRVRFTPFYYKIDNGYLVYFDLENEGDYSFGVEGIPLIVNNTEVEKSTRKDFNVRASNKVLSIKPGFFNLDNVIEIEVINDYDNAEVSFLTPEFVKHPYKIESVASNRSRVFRFNVETEKAKNNFNITLDYKEERYEIPVFVKIKKEYKDVLKFLTDLDFLEKTIGKDEILKGALGFQNLLDEPLYDLSFILTGNLNKIVRLNVTKLGFLDSGARGEQYIWVNEKGNASGEYSGELILRSDKDKISMKMRFVVSEEKEEQELEIPEKEDVVVSEPKEERKEELFPFQREVNFTSQPETVRRTSMGFMMFLVFILIIGLLIFLLSKKRKEKKTFGEYVKEYEKR